MSQDNRCDRLQEAVRSAPRTILFLRSFDAPSGGHLKVWHYFQHTAHAAGFVSKVHFTPGSRLDASNPWIAAGIVPEEQWQPEAADAVFLGGMDWSWIDTHPAGTAGRPVLNIIQGLRHTEPTDPRYGYLGRPAIRISVNPLIGRALQDVPDVRGPVQDVPMGLDIVPDAGGLPEGDGVVIAALKDVPLGQRVAAGVSAAGASVRLIDSALPREQFLAAIATARVLVCLPMMNEGFYLPALEGMAMGRIVVCPDCGGNRAYLRHAWNGLMPARQADAIVSATLQALELGSTAQTRMREAALSTAASYSLRTEREVFQSVLARLDQLWGACS